MTDADITVVLVANNKSSEADELTDYLNKHFPAINIENMNTSEVASSAYKHPVALFIKIINTKLTPWTHNIDGRTSPRRPCYPLSEARTSTRNGSAEVD